MILPQTSRSVSIVLLALLLADCVHQYHHQSFIAPVATAQQLSLHSGWSFSADLTFPSSSNALNSYTDVALFSFFTPILSSSSFNNGSKGFSLGFLSLYDAPGGHPSEISLSVCLGVPGDDVGGGRPFLIPVWSSSQPSGQKVIVTRLQVHENGRLSLLGEDGKEVWAVADAASMEMRNDGNLIVRDSGNRSVWESFNNPRDCLLPGQKVSVGMEMASSNGMYKVVMQDGGLLFYQVSEYEWPLTYLIYTANATVDSYFANMGTAFTLDRNAPINLTASVASPNCSAAEKFNRSQAIVVLDLSSAAILLKDACGNVNSLPTNRTTDVVRLDVDGFIRDYTVRQLPNTSYELFSETSQQRPCFTPNACGSYGICSVSNTVGNAVRRLCRCPSEIDNTNLTGVFSFIDDGNPSQGCRRNTPLDCSERSLQSLQQITSVTFMSILPIFEYTWREDTMPLEACKAACISNCSCSGFFYERQSSYCLSFGDRTSLSNVTFLSIPSDDHIVFVKVQTSRGPGRNSLPVIVSSAVAVPVILTVFILLAIYCMRKLSILDRGLKLAEEELLGVLPTPPTRYSYRELRRYTHHFRQRLGSGGFGSVYEGMLPDGRRVAVKNLETLSHGQKEFLAEIATIGGTSHLNIVNLYGYCLERKHRLLVYEYMENGSLDRWLFCKDEDQFHKLSWETRFKIGLSTARGLAYLHEECPKPILHFDVKPQNILLDENFDAKLADFGLAKLVAKGQSMVNTVVRGTPGYIAPEWVSHSIVSKKCDVYSFGMVLLELVSGRRNAEIELMGSEEYYFPKFAAKKAREGRFSDLIDKRLMKSAAINEQFSLEQVETVIRVALSCIHVEPEMRPSMTVVCGMLEGSIVLPNDVLDFSVYNAPLFEISPSGSIKHHSDLFPTTR